MKLVHIHQALVTGVLAACKILHVQARCSHSVQHGSVSAAHWVPVHTFATIHFPSVLSGHSSYTFEVQSHVHNAPSLHNILIYMYYIFMQWYTFAMYMVAILCISLYCLQLLTHVHLYHEQESPSKEILRMVFLATCTCMQPNCAMYCMYMYLKIQPNLFLLTLHVHQF